MSIHQVTQELCAFVDDGDNDPDEDNHEEVHKDKKIHFDQSLPSSHTVSFVC